MKIRSNASLKATAKAAAKRARFVDSLVARQHRLDRDNGNNGPLGSTRARDLYTHWVDVSDLAKHLCRFAGITETFEREVS